MMKLLLGLVALVGAAQACVQGRQWVTHRSDKHMAKFEAHVNGKLVCKGEVEFTANENFHVCYESSHCSTGYKYCFWDHGKKASLEYSVDGVSVFRRELQSQKTFNIGNTACGPCSGARCESCHYYDTCLRVPNWGTCSGECQITCGASGHPINGNQGYNNFCDNGNRASPVPSVFDNLPKKNIKAMIMGDSITHGMDGDHTWRYRVHQWLSRSHTNVQFVGPFSGTYGSSVANPPKPPSFQNAPPEGETFNDAGGYYPGIGSWQNRHGAHWGRQAAQAKHNIEPWMRAHNPDTILILLGFNDVGWFVDDAQGTFDSILMMVYVARQVNPSIDVIIGTIPQRTRISGRQDLIDKTNALNTMIRNAVPQWDAPQYNSRCVLAEVQLNYECTPDSGCPDAYDGLHPNPRGEYHIAQAFSRALISIGYGYSELVLPQSGIPADGTPDITGFTVSADPRGIYARWDKKQARRYELRSRVQGNGWGDTTSTTQTAWYTTWVLAGQTWEFQVRTCSDDRTCGAWSAIRSAVANPQTAPGPSNLISYPTNGGLTVSWTPPVGVSVERYEVIIFDEDQPGAWIQGYGVPSSSTSFSLGGLVNGHRHVVAVATWTMIGRSPAGGFPTIGRGVRPGYFWPAPPVGVSVVNLDPTSVRLSWQAVPDAVGYRVWVRNVANGDPFPTNQDYYGTTSGTSHGIGFMFPGTWNFELCVGSYNGMYESARSLCVRPPVYPGWKNKRAANNGTEGVKGNGTTTQPGWKFFETEESKRESKVLGSGLLEGRLVGRTNGWSDMLEWAGKNLTAGVPSF